MSFSAFGINGKIVYHFTRESNASSFVTLFSERKGQVGLQHGKMLGWSFSKRLIKLY